MEAFSDLLSKHLGIIMKLKKVKTDAEQEGLERELQENFEDIKKYPRSKITEQDLRLLEKYEKYFANR